MCSHFARKGCGSVPLEDFETIVNCLKDVFNMERALACHQQSERFLANQKCSTHCNGILNKAVKHKKYESFDARLKSYDKWPSYAKKTPCELASFGFFYEGNQDVVKCFTCGIAIYDWEEGDIVLMEHRKYSPNCKFISKYLYYDEIDSNETG
jgi:hypothetical protein